VGIKVGVASTKSFTSQLTILTLMTLLIGRRRDLSYEEGHEILRALEKVPEQIREILKQAGKVREFAEKYCHSDHFLWAHRSQRPSMWPHLSGGCSARGGIEHAKI
jgi:glucosamine--fructose-6-phosphate aminotransferase (isomerizing)